MSVNQDASRSLIGDLKSIIEDQLDEPLPPFVYSIILATRLNLIATRLGTLLDTIMGEPVRSAVDAEIEAIRAIANVIESAELHL